MIHLFIVDNVLINCQALSALLNSEPDMQVVGATIYADEALKQLAALECNVAIISSTLPDGSALPLTEKIHTDYPHIRLIVSAIPNTSAIIMRYIEAGAKGYLLFDESAPILLKKIRAAFEERAVVAPEIAANLIERVAFLAEHLANLGIDPDDYETLTAREKEVLNLIADGMTNQQIAEKLTIEIGTVKNHVHNILNKLDVHTRHDAAIYLSLMERNVS